VGQKDTFAPPTQLLGGARAPAAPPKSTPMLVIVHDELHVVVFSYL